MKINNAIFKVADAENYDGEFDIITFLTVYTIWGILWVHQNTPSTI